jgi:hypothetical protein
LYLDLLEVLGCLTAGMTGPDSHLCSFAVVWLAACSATIIILLSVVRNYLLDLLKMLEGMTGQILFEIVISATCVMSVAVDAVCLHRLLSGVQSILLTHCLKAVVCFSQAKHLCAC